MIFPMGFFRFMEISFSAIQISSDTEIVCRDILSSNT